MMRRWALGMLGFGAACGGTGSSPVEIGVDPSLHLQAAASSDKLTKVRDFQIEVDGAIAMEGGESWLRCSGGGDVIEVEQTALGSDQYHSPSLGRLWAGEITLSGGFTPPGGMRSWVEGAGDGSPPPRKTVKILVHSEDGAPIAHYTFNDAATFGFIERGDKLSVRVHYESVDFECEGVGCVLEEMIGRVDADAAVDGAPAGR